ncbi:type II toxin-antitoxin system RelE/ParE family toxin [Virgibacillus necropolis]|uniref:type II toxin-antitoxin system RelE/ParE family toxin n=1 Tax=Virgibacillus necropolis TaxID=163877 RepID=UPI003850175E
MENSKFTVKMTQKANSDLERIYIYVMEESTSINYADHILDRIEKNIMRLQDFPYSANFVKDEVLKQKGYRKLIVDNYIIFFLTQNDKKKVTIMRILYVRQNYQKYL